MAASKTKTIIIDTDIIQAAGYPSRVNPRSRVCREFLRSVLTICHCTAVCSELWAEWKGHKSHFSHTWLTEMFGQKKIKFPDDFDDSILGDKIRKHCKDDDILAIIQKDIRLCTLALIHDGLVASMDYRARKHLSNLSKTIVELQQIVWVNPEKPDEKVITWLEIGAPVEKERTLSQYHKSEKRLVK